MRLRYAILAKYAEYSPSGLLNIIGGDLDKIVVDSFPAVIPQLLVAIRIDATAGEMAEHHHVLHRIVDPRVTYTEDDGPQGGTYILNGTPSPPEYRDQPVTTSYVFPMLETRYTSAGIYELQIIMDPGLHEAPPLGVVQFMVNTAAGYRRLAPIPRSGRPPQ